MSDEPEASTTKSLLGALGPSLLLSAAFFCIFRASNSEWGDTTFIWLFFGFWLLVLRHAQERLAETEHELSELNRAQMIVDDVVERLRKPES